MIHERIAGAIEAVKNRLSPRVKYEAEFSDGFDRLLARLAWEKGISKAEVIRNAVATYAYFQKELHSENGEKRHLVIREGDKILQRVNLP